LVIHQLTQHALDGEINPAQRIKSLELLGKVAGVDVFMDRKETTVIHQSGDIKARLLNQLKAVIDDLEIVKLGNPCHVYHEDLLYKVDCDSERIRDFQKQGAK
jgi:hypothetical protein